MAAWGATGVLGARAGSAADAGRRPRRRGRPPTWASGGVARPAADRALAAGARVLRRRVRVHGRPGRRRLGHLQRPQRGPARGLRRQGARLRRRPRRGLPGVRAGLRSRADPLDRRFARRLQVTLDRRRGAAPPADRGALAAVALGAGLGGARRAPARAGRFAGSRYLLGPRTPTAASAPRRGQPSAELYHGLGGARPRLRRPGPAAGRRRGRRLLAYIRARARPAGPGVAWSARSWSSAPPVCRRGSFAGRDLVAALERRIRGDGSVADQVNLTAFAILAAARRRRRPGRPHDRVAASASRTATAASASPAPGGSSDPRRHRGRRSRRWRGGGRSGAGTRHAPSPTCAASRTATAGFPPRPGARPMPSPPPGRSRDSIAAGVAPGSLHRGGAPSPLAYLRSLIAPDGRVRYARGTDQTPVWVTGEALMALEGKPLPLAHADPATSRARRPARGGAGVPARGPGTPISRRRTDGAPAAGRSAHARRDAAPARRGAGTGVRGSACPTGPASRHRWTPGRARPGLPPRSCWPRSARLIGPRSARPVTARPVAIARQSVRCTAA